jgi:hypothetical protein
MPQSSWNIAKVGIKHQSINQSVWTFFYIYVKLAIDQSTISDIGAISELPFFKNYDAIFLSWK